MIRCEAEVFVPRPVWVPMGTLPPVASVAPAGRDVSYMRSWNSSRDFLNPVVLLFARLLAMVSM
ncbi:hypothetical protein D3C83_268630 [compost metagenome]